jgi:hypothetical protein
MGGMKRRTSSRKDVKAATDSNGDTRTTMASHTSSKDSWTRASTHGISRTLSHACSRGRLRGGMGNGDKTRRPHNSKSRAHTLPSPLLSSCATSWEARCRSSSLFTCERIRLWYSFDGCRGGVWRAKCILGCVKGIGISVLTWEVSFKAEVNAEDAEPVSGSELSSIRSTG